MRFFKLIKYDLSYGIFNLKNLIKYIIFILFFTVACFELSGRLMGISSYQDVSGISAGDHLFYIFGGMKEYIPSPSDPFQIPYLWLINHLLILYFTLHYASDDLSGVGQQMIYRAGGRIKWWVSKCIWNFTSVVSYYLISMSTIIVFCLIKGNEISLTFSSFMRNIMYFGPKDLGYETWDIALEVTLMPFLVTLALSILQMALSLVFKPAFAFIFSSVMLISSAYYMTPYLIGNFSMAVRSDKVVSNGLNLTDGIIAAIGMIIIGIIIGVLAIRRYNILSKE
ncbi:MAG: hypothetical protein E7564_09860 [Ruminococcaceae bacterium]|nr:hypothetical protein [Oscillospiraceae bacterium]